MTVWGYARVSTPTQKIDRQIDNIKRQYPEAVIISEAFTGTTTDRPAWAGLEKRLKPGDTVIFDEVSRMSRNAAEGMALYEKLFNADINLVFLKEPYINSSVYREALEKQKARHNMPEMTEKDVNELLNISTAAGKFVDGIMKLLRVYTIDVVREHIEIAFRMAQKEVDLLHQRTSEGMKKAQTAGKQIGRRAGSSPTTKKGRKAKEIIKRHSKDFGGSLTDAECWTLAGISRNSFYKYKRELREDPGSVDGSR